MAFNSNEYAWKDIVIAVNGKPMLRATAVGYTESQEVKKLRGKGTKPFKIATGNIDLKGKIEMYQSEFDVLLAATGNKGVAGFTDLIVTIAFESEGSLSTRSLIGVCVTEIGEGVNQGDLDIIVPLPFEALDIKYL
jgi:hypothetical protein